MCCARNDPDPACAALIDTRAELAIQKEAVNQPRESRYPAVWKLKPGQPGFHNYARSLLTNLKGIAPYSCTFKPGKKVQLFKHQAYASYLVHPESTVKRIGLFHELGSGKTLTMISILENHWRDSRPKIVLVKNAKQQTNFIQEILSKESKYRAFAEQVLKTPPKPPRRRQWKKGMPNPNPPPGTNGPFNPAFEDWCEDAAEVLAFKGDPKGRRYGENYTNAPKSAFRVFTYKDKDAYDNPLISQKKTFNDCIVIVDEAHNMWRPPDEYDSAQKSKTTLALKKIAESRGSTVVLATATPIVSDDPQEDISIINKVLHGTWQGPGDFKEGFISWYRARPKAQFAIQVPAIEETDRDFEKMVMISPIEGKMLDEYLFRRCGIKKKKKKLSDADCRKKGLYLGLKGRCVKTKPLNDAEKRAQKEENCRKRKLYLGSNGRCVRARPAGYVSPSTQLGVPVTAENAAVAAAFSPGHRGSALPVAISPNTSMLLADRLMPGWRTHSSGSSRAAGPAGAAKNLNMSPRVVKCGGKELAKADRKKLQHYEYSLFAYGNVGIKAFDARKALETATKLYDIALTVKLAADRGEKSMVQIHKRNGYFLLEKLLKHMDVKVLSLPPPRPGQDKLSVAQKKKLEKFELRVQKEFNSPTNSTGREASCMLLDAAQYTEALSLKDVRNIILADISEGDGAASWSLCRQRIARALRTCSHSSLEPGKRKARIMLFVASILEPGIKTIDEMKLNELRENRRVVMAAERDIAANAIDKGCYPP